ncbi:hypothetical protein GWO43_10725 [candidate division KSB1 bacterium]|nr:hypothetical protein [candidate division KSB1 bacterium]NIR70011.1 hypothetical protein [candidate division KSB1 bacterium]NIS24410.1 hypothetical protein [candidate division KSB1 bacterium]NIT71345.1 hypothetical protein [candidate division KSB1 bacterium]NIU25025.1 hypothetical protein [candidate division KSB1 bacterium]
MAYHKQADKAILYGGLWINGQYADLWEWSDGKWNSRGGPYDNSSLDHHAMVYDEKLERVIMFGGKNYRYQVQQNTLTVVGDKVIVLSRDGPSGRHSIGLAYDSQHRYGYLYGGKEYQGDNQVALGDFWKWDGEKWEKIE